MWKHPLAALLLLALALVGCGQGTNGIPGLTTGISPQALSLPGVGVTPSSQLPPPVAPAALIQGSAPQYPWVFVHGHNSNSQIWWNQYGAVEILDEGRATSGGFAVPSENRFAVDYYLDNQGQTAFADITEYARRLKVCIDAILVKTNAPQVHLIGHSMGGIIIREYFRQYYPTAAAKVFSTITLGTPHSGAGKDMIDLINQGEGGQMQTELEQIKEGSTFLKGLNQWWQKNYTGGRVLSLHIAEGDMVLEPSETILPKSTNRSGEANSFNLGLSHELATPALPVTAIYHHHYRMAESAMIRGIIEVWCHEKRADIVISHGRHFADGRLADPFGHISVHQGDQSTAEGRKEFASVTSTLSPFPLSTAVVGPIGGAYHQQPYFQTTDHNLVQLNTLNQGSQPGGLAKGFGLKIYNGPYYQGFYFIPQPVRWMTILYNEN